MSADRRRALVLAAACAVLTWAFCGAFLRGRGLYGETVFYELSQTRSWWQGFIYPYQATRPLVSVPYQLGYLFSNGSYEATNLVFVVYVMATGVLTYLLVRELFPDAPFAAAFAGAVALVHGADHMAMYVPGFTVRQAVVLAVAAVLLFLVAYRRRSLAVLCAALLAQAAALWTYEPGLLALVAAPMLALPAARADWRRWLRWSLVWEAVAALYVAAYIKDYLDHRETSYQASRLVTHFSIADVIWREMAIAAESLAFWRWPLLWFRTQAAGCVSDVLPSMAGPLVIGSVVAAVAFWWLRKAAPASGDRGSLLTRLAVAVFFLLLCAAPYSIVNNTWFEGGPWRTQFFVAIPAAVLLALVVDALWRQSRAAGLVLATAIIAAGLAAGLTGQRGEHIKWHEYRKVMAAIVDRAPRLKQDSMIVLAGVPSPVFESVCPSAPVFDPFSNDEIWFNSGLQVLYPDTRLLGIYWTRARESPGSIQFDFSQDGAALRKATISIKGTAYRYDQMVAFAYDDTRGAVLLDAFPAGDVPGSIASPSYRPLDRILPGPAPIETVRKLVE